MSFKNALTKMGLVEEEVQATKPKAPTPTPTSSQAAYTAPSFYQPSAPTPTVDPAISDMLNQSLQASKLTGFDYMKFISSVEKMKSTGISEDARFKAVFSTAQELGVSKPELVKSGEHYLTVLKEDEDDFNNDCSQFEKKEIQGREAKISEVENTINTLAKQLAAAQEQHETLKSELEEKKSSLETRKSSFQVTLQSFRATIESNLQKINQFLQ